MAPTYGPIPKRNKNVNDGLYQHKIMPSYHGSKEVEFQPAVPCVKCFPGYRPLNFESECLGIQNVIMKSSYSKNASLSRSLSLLQKHFDSIQVHTGQLELLCRISSVKVFVAHYKSDWDLQILAHVLADKLGKSTTFLNLNPSSSPNLKFPVPDGETQPGEDRSIQVLLINFDDSEPQMKEMYHQILSNPDALDICLIPVAISYEFTPGNALNSNNDVDAWKPRVRLNFGLPHFFREFTNQTVEKDNLVLNLRKHLHHEIWKNTAIMSTHLVSTLLNYRLGPNPSKSDCTRLITEFQTEFRSFFDFAFVGEIDNIAEYSLKLLAANLDAAPLSLPADLLKHESIMIKSLFTIMDMTSVDHQSETCKISQKAVLEKFQEMAKILRYDLEYIHPPCMEWSAIEERTFDRLARHSVASLQSSETNSEEQQKALRIARHLDIDYEDEDDDDYWPLPVHSSQDVSLYVTISNAISRKWVAEIAESLLNIYYVAARQLLELRKVDVMEESDFLGNVADAMNVSPTKKISGESLKNTVKNALRMFADEGIIGSHQHSTVTVIYVKNPLDTDNLCSLIHNIAQFV